MVQHVGILGFALLERDVSLLVFYHLLASDGSIVEDKVFDLVNLCILVGDGHVEDAVHPTHLVCAIFNATKKPEKLVKFADEEVLSCTLADALLLDFQMFRC